MTYPELIRSVCGEKYVSFYTKGLENAKKELEKDDGKDLSEEEMVKILNDLKDEAVYSVQGMISVGAFILSILALLLSLGTSIISLFLKDNQVILYGVTWAVLCLLGASFGLRCLRKARECNIAYGRITHMEKALLLEKKGDEDGEA